MRPIVQAALALAALVAAIAWALVLIEMTQASPKEAPAPVELPDLDEIEARMVRAQEITSRWEWLRERHERVSEVACEAVQVAATVREVQ